MLGNIHKGKRSASCSNLPVNHLRPGFRPYNMALDFVGVPQSATSYTDAELEFPGRHPRPFPFETTQSLDADASDSESVSASIMEQSGQIASSTTSLHSIQHPSLPVQSFAQLSIQSSYRYSPIRIIEDGHLTDVPWDLENSSTTTEFDDDTPPPKHYSPEGNFAILPTEIIHKILGYLVPANRSRIDITSLNCVGPSLSDCFMSFRLTSKHMQTLVLKYWKFKQAQTGFMDSTTFGLIKPSRTTFILNADQLKWNACAAPGRICSFQQRNVCLTPGCLKSALVLIQRFPLACRQLVQKVQLRLHQFDRMGAPEDVDYEAIIASLSVLRDSLPSTTRVEMRYFENPRPFTSWEEWEVATGSCRARYGDEHVYLPLAPGIMGWLRDWKSPVVVYDMWAKRIVKGEFDMRIPKKLRSVWVPFGQKAKIGTRKNYVEVGRGDRIEGVTVAGPEEAPRLVDLDTPL